jgi:hypothetical protein
MPCRVNSHMPCRAPAVPLPCRAALFTHAMPMFLITTFVEISMATEEAERGQVAHIPTLDGGWKFTHAMSCSCRARAALCRGLEKSL